MHGTAALKGKHWETVMGSTLRSSSVLGGNRMANHVVRMSLPQGLVVNSDVEFTITSDGKKLGEVHLSKGTIDWRPAGAKKAEHRLKWEKFADLMIANGHG
jgi:hypothetical protein